MIDNDIINSVQVPQLVKDSFFQNGILEKDHRDRPIHYSGGFAIVFVFNVNGEKWAFRCWRNQPEKDIAHRLETLSEEFKKINLQYFCDFTFEPKGIVVNGSLYPTTRMRWIEGQKLNEYIYQHKSDTEILKKLADDFKNMCNNLHERRIAHGDLQHGNILVDEKGKIYLIDYDSMFAPSLEKERDIIKGKEDYQHPNRNGNEYANCKLDYFSELVIYISLLAISEEPTLADKYDIENAERLLFQKDDFSDIRNSNIYKDINNLSQQLRELSGILVWYLEQDNILDLAPFGFIEGLKELDVSYGEKAICMNCGTFFTVNEETKFCINCGKRLLDYKLR